MKTATIPWTLLLILPLYGQSDEGSWGKVQGQIRAFTMIEDNQEPLHDYEGTALGGKLIYHSPQWNHLQSSVGVYTAHYIKDNISSTNVEPLAGNKNSRYVAGMVDSVDYDASSVTNIGEANIRYTWNNNSLILGRMKLTTPFMNPHDGRMIPSFEQGIWGNILLSKEWNVQGGYINAMWNRSTSDWKSVEDSLGYGYEMGVSSLDVKIPSNYYGNTTSNGLFIANIRYEPTKNFRLDIWDYYLENIFNLAYAETEFSHPLGLAQLAYAFQYIYQKESGDGGNSEDNIASATIAQKAKSYMQEGEKSNTYGLKTALKYQTSKFTLAYNQTTHSGRWLFPREWGKDPLFTFQKREKNEGSGNCHAWLASVEHEFGPQGLSGLELILGYGEYHKTDVKDWRYNKYGMPSYAHWDIDLFYRFSGPLKGLRAEYLMARKVARGETYQTPSDYNYIFRKNGLTMHNFILTYDF